MLGQLVLQFTFLGRQVYHLGRTQYFSAQEALNSLKHSETNSSFGCRVSRRWGVFGFTMVFQGESGRDFGLGDFGVGSNLDCFAWFAFTDVCTGTKTEVILS